MTRRTCAHPQCDLGVAHWQLACRGHWYDLPTGLRDAIWRAYRQDDGASHAVAVREALQVWEGPPSPSEPDPSPRCQHCRAPADFTDPENDRGVCLVCARAGMSGSVLLQPCARCGADVEVLVSLTRRDPDHCLGCITEVLQLVEALA